MVWLKGKVVVEDERKMNSEASARERGSPRAFQTGKSVDLLTQHGSGIAHMYDIQV